MPPLPKNPAPVLRWFVALLPPESIQRQVTDVIADLTARYQTRTAKAPPHITLVPPFVLAANAIGPVRLALEDFAKQQRTLTVTLHGFNAFPPRVLFVDVVRSPQLLTLKTELEECLVEQCDLPRDRHSRFNPHITVASRKLDRSKFKATWAELEQQQFEATGEHKTLTLLRYEQQHWHVDQLFQLALPA